MIGRDTFPAWNRQLAETRLRGLREDYADALRSGCDASHIEAQIDVARRALNAGYDQSPPGWLQAQRDRDMSLCDVRPFGAGVML